MNNVKKFCSDLATWSRTTGVVIHVFIIRSIVLLTKIFLHTNIPLCFQVMDELKLPIFTARPGQVEADLSKHCQDAWNMLGGKKIGLLLAILPDKNGSLYGNIFYSKLSFFTDYDVYVMPDTTLNNRKFQKDL